MKKTIAISILILGLSSCSDSSKDDSGTGTTETGTGTTTISYTTNAKAIFDANCVSCHAVGGAAAFRPLTNYAEVKAAITSAGLLDRIQLQSGQQGAMPQGGRMSQTNIDLILKWNSEGLKN